MNVSVNSTSTNAAANLNSASAGFNKSLPVKSAVSTHETAFNLGLWLSGLESYLRIRTRAFAETNQTKTVARDWSKEFRLTHLGLLICSNFALRLCEAARDVETEIEEINLIDKLKSPAESFNLSFDDISTLSVNLKNLTLLNKALLRAAPHNLGEWASWSEILGNGLRQTEVTAQLIANAESEGARHLPPVLLEMFQKTKISSAARADLQNILPHFAKIMKWLEVVGKMLADDEPLKPALLIFARIYEQAQMMMSHIRNRLLRFPSEEDALYGVLDCALYAASIELRKVFNFELAGLSEMRQPISIRAKIETSYSLLNDCIQLILVQFAHFIEPDFEPTALFPNFQTKLEQSLALRQDLWNIQRLVKRAEQNPENALLEELNKKLNDFLRTELRFLMFKDCETFERFAEEVTRTRNKKDLVPILHRFGAYLETLFGQVNMRTALANHPFDYLEKEK
ncbi:MAG: hypothetical protein ACR2GD_12785 [Pyrinomonadaceae bacterium]